MGEGTESSKRADSMEDMLDQLLEAVNHHLYYPALYCALAVPDACGALGAKNGKATGETYAKWFNEEVGSKYRAIVGADLSQPPPIPDEYLSMIPQDILDSSGKEYVFLSGEDCYKYRCSVLHQGRSDKKYSNFNRIMFVYTETDSPHRCSQVNDALVINVVTFCRDIVEAAHSWMSRMKGTEPFDSNYARLLKEHPEGSGAIYPPFPVVY
jgi:hypothetical protein